MDMARDRRNFNEAQKARIENAAILIASGLIAGEALMGMVKAGFAIADKPLSSIFSFFRTPPTVAGLIVLALLALLMIRWPLAKAGDPNEPAPPAAIV